MQMGSSFEDFIQCTDDSEVNLTAISYTENIIKFTYLVPINQWECISCIIFSIDIYENEGITTITSLYESIRDLNVCNR